MKKENLKYISTEKDEKQDKTGIHIVEIRP
jgi:hypothetical protein